MGIIIGMIFPYAIFKKACKYKEFERFEGDLGKKNEMYTGLICFNLV